MDFYGDDFEDAVSEYEEGYEDGHDEADLVDQFDADGIDPQYEFDHMDVKDFGMALGLAEEMVVGNEEFEQETFNLGNEVHQQAISLKATETKEDPFFKYVRETCAGTRSLNDYFTREERIRKMYEEYV